MKITRKNLNKLIETFIASEDGKVRRVRGDDRDKKHPHADRIMSKATGNLPTNLRDKLSTMYGTNDDDPETKRHAIELAAGLGNISSDEVDSAKFDIDVATNPAFVKVKKRVGPLVGDPVDKGLLKTFLNYLYKKGILRPGYFHHSEITKMFKRMYPHPGAGTPGYLDYYSLGMVIDNEDGFIDEFDPERFRL